MGDAETTVDPAKTDEGHQAQSERGQKTAENIRYGQGISEGGMGGMTDGTGEAGKEGYGRIEDQEGQDGGSGRETQGYGGSKDMDKSVGA